ncbi:hypothetical protein [Streptomyces harbinensis]
MSQNEPGRSLRTRREAVTPADAGLPTGPRRRTPGLRRSASSAARRRADGDGRVPVHGAGGVGVRAAPPRRGAADGAPGADGELRLAYETPELPADDDQRLLVYLPADEGTAARLAALPAAGERLRAV